jgi:hypothetical protein
MSGMVKELIYEVAEENEDKIISAWVETAEAWDFFNGEFCEVGATKEQWCDWERGLGIEDIPNDYIVQWIEKNTNTFCD